MQSLLAAAALLTLSAVLAKALPGSGTLTLTPATTTENRLSVKITATASGMTASDTQYTNISGVLDIILNADPQNGATTVFTILGGNVAMTDMAFNLKAGFISVAKINTSGMKGTAFTAVPPGVVTPTGTGGTFNASQHRVRINEGAITGTVTIPFQPSTPINANFADSPVEGPGQGTGVLTVVLGTASATNRNCAVTMTLPVDFTDSQDLDGTPVSITVKGTIKATGTIPVPLSEWVEWTIANNLTGTPFGAVIAVGGAPLGLAWAMGFGPNATAVAVKPVMRAGAPPSALVRLGAAASRGTLLLEQSDALTGSWQPVPPAAVSGGQNPLPVGTAGEITIQLSAPAGRRFVRVAAVQP